MNCRTHGSKICRNLDLLCDDDMRWTIVPNHDTTQKSIQDADSDYWRHLATERPSFAVAESQFGSATVMTGESGDS